MTGVQIFLVIVGIVAIVGSFVFTEFLDKGRGVDGDFLAGLRDEDVRRKVNEMVEEAVNEAIEERIDKTERQLEKISNEKIMAVSNYSENVLDEIFKNHEEVMFLYGILKDKETDIKNTVLDVEAVKKSVRAMEQTAVSRNWDSRNQDSRNQDARNQDSRNRDSRNQDSKNQDSMNQNSVNQDSMKQESESKNHSLRKKGQTKIETGKRDIVKGSNNKQRVLELYHQGKTTMEIAKELKLGMGEVRLVIDLYVNKEV